MIYDKDFLAKLELFTTNIPKALATYEGHEALRQVEILRKKKHINPKEYFKIAYLGLTRAIKEGNKITELKYIHDIGFYHYKIGEYDEAFMYYAQGIYISESVKSREFEARFQNRIGEIYVHRVNYEQALDCYFKVLRWDDDRYCNETYSNIAKLYKEKKDFNVALEYLDKAINYNQKTDNYGQLITDLTTTGDINFTKNKYGHALSFYARAIKICDVHENPYSKTIAIIGSGNVLFELGHYKEACGLYEYASEISNDYSYKYLSTLSNSKTSLAYAEMGDYKKASELNEKALKTAQDNNYDLLELTILRNERLYAEALNQEGKALRLLRKTENLQIAITLKEQRDKLEALIAEKEKELEFFKSQTRAQAAANDDLKQYAKITAHDLKEPLRTISSFTTLLEKKYGEVEKEDLNECFRYIQEGTSRMSHLLDDLLGYLVLGINDTRPVKVNLQKLVDSVIKELKEDIKSKKVNISVAKLPTILGQKTQLRDLFFHLIDNAIKFNTHEKPSIDITVQRQGPDYLFVVSDNGMGVNSDYYDKIFLIFHKLEQDHKDSTGIGLAISKKIVELHGGNIWIVSKIGGGTKIEFTLPDI